MMNVESELNVENGEWKMCGSGISCQHFQFLTFHSKKFSVFSFESGLHFQFSIFNQLIMTIAPLRVRGPLAETSVLAVPVALKAALAEKLTLRPEPEISPVADISALPVGVSLMLPVAVSDSVSASTSPSLLFRLPT